MNALVAIALYAIGAAWTYLLNRELAFAKRREAAFCALIWPALALSGIAASIARRRRTGAWR